MPVIASFKKLINRTHPIQEKNSSEAYDIWSESYDHQPGNLMLDLDEQLFTELLQNADLNGKSVADIGCGTGRHWRRLLSKNPNTLTGFDVSEGMLKQLKNKYPASDVHHIANNTFGEIADGIYDVIISTLTVAHIANLAEALQNWSRILKDQAEIIITDFHPNALANGGKRTFEHDKQVIAVENFVHYTYDVEETLAKEGFHTVELKYRVVDESVKHYYEGRNAVHVYEKFQNSRIIYGIYFKRG
jgi:ubiquinone/menaquinone biosynthesis C-methylase UbiE